MPQTIVHSELDKVSDWRYNRSDRCFYRLGLSYMTLLEETQKLIKDYLQNHPNLTMAHFARVSGKPASTVRSIVQGEVKQTSLENITALLLVFMPVHEVMELVSRHTSESDDFWNGIIRAYGEKSSAAAINANGFEWKNPDHLIIALASLPNGLDRNMIAKAFGERDGSNRVKALLDAGYLREINGKLKHPESYLVFNLLDSRKRAVLHAIGWGEEEVNNGGWLYHITQNYSPEGHEKAKRLARKFLDDLLALEKEYPNGDQILVFTMLASLLKEGDLR
jgi:hypothetical protein